MFWDLISRGLLIQQLIYGVTDHMTSEKQNKTFTIANYNGGTIENVKKKKKLFV